MALGFGLLGLEPRAFWSMTVRELEAALRWRLGPVACEGPPTAGEMSALMKRFPDAG